MDTFVNGWMQLRRVMIECSDSPLFADENKKLKRSQIASRLTPPLYPRLSIVGGPLGRPVVRGEVGHSKRSTCPPHITNYSVPRSVDASIFSVITPRHPFRCQSRTKDGRRRRSLSPICSLSGFLLGRRVAICRSHQQLSASSPPHSTGISCSSSSTTVTSSPPPRYPPLPTQTPLPSPRTRRREIVK